MKYFYWRESDEYAIFEAKEEAKDDMLDYWRLTSYIENWKPPELQECMDFVKKPRKRPDFLSTTSFSHLVSKQVIECVDEFNKTGHLLPVKTENKEEEYFLYVCTNIVDCLDIEKSEVKYSVNNSKQIVLVFKSSFIEDKVKGHHLFTIPQCKNTHIFISEFLVEKIKQSKLKGLILKESYWSEDIEIK